MNMGMRTTTFITTLLLLLTTALPASAQQSGRVRLLTTEAPTVYAGESVWVAFNWTARRAGISQFEATVTGPRGVEIEYPTNTGTFTGLMDGHVLDSDEIDFTAVKVTVPFDQEDEVRLRFTVKYDDGTGRIRTDRFRAEIPVYEFNGRGTVTQLDSSTTVAAGSSEWIDVDYTTRAPRADDVSMTITDNAGLTVVYPASGAATSLHHDHRLSRGETDTARFRVDAEGAAPGDYVLSTLTTYTMDGRTRTLEGKVAISISG